MYNNSVELKGLVYNIQRYSIHDGPGIRTIVFLKGCPLRCIWCCNPESQFTSQEVIFNPMKCIGCGRCLEVCPTGTAELYLKEDYFGAKRLCNNCGKCVEVCPSSARELIGNYMSLDEIMKEIENDIPFYRNSGGGVTLSGGEPLIQASFVSLLLKKCQEKGINTAVETAGYVKWENFKKVIQYVDIWLYDIKHLNNKKHKELTGVGNELILENISKIAALKKEIIIRVPIISDCQDSLEEVESIAEFARSLKIKEVHLLPYHRLGESKYSQLGRNYKLKGITPPTESSIFRLKEIVELYNLKVYVGGQ